MAILKPFHDGELAIQERTGDRAVAARNGAMIGDRVMRGAWPFLAEQRLLAVATGGGPWASVWLGSPGFVTSEDDGSVVVIARDAFAAAEGDPVIAGLAAGDPIGLLAIELETRRRLRINGHVAALGARQIRVHVEESFPNCPKYIQRRDLGAVEPASRIASAHGAVLDDARRALVARVDTAFVASGHPERGVDVSHRGGEPGFVHVRDERTLRFPDYAGNGMYQTLGNLVVAPRAGLALVDFAEGRLLHLTGTTALSFGVEDASHPTGGTGRYWTFTLESWVETPFAVALGAERSRFNPPAGR